VSASSRLQRTILVLLIPFVLAGCVAPAGRDETPSYARLVEDLRAGRSGAWDRLDPAFLELPDVQQRLEELGLLHRRAASTPDGDRAGLTRLAESMLDQYYGDMQAHELRRRLALAAGSEETAAFHADAVADIVEAIAASGDGSAEAPYRVLTAPQAHAWLRRRGADVVGALYTTDDEAPRLTLVTKVRQGEREPLAEIRFDLTPTFLAGTRDTLAMSGGEIPLPSGVVATRAAQGDPAAQTAHAIAMWHEGPQHAGRAVQWLRAASESGNLVAREMLGVIYGSLASGRTGAEADRLLDAAVDQFLLAVNQGSDSAMYNLAQLYLSGHFGEENQPAGVALLRQAAARDNLDALVMLARLHYNGQYVGEDRERAIELLRRASAGGHAEAQLFHARHLLTTDDGAGFDDQALAWLREAASGGSSVDAMMLMGSLLARGEQVPADPAEAVAWFKRAAAATDDAETINSVAWMLAVAENRALRDPDAALQLMDDLMHADEAAAANPAYIDTWAAAHAATGAFEDAVEIQSRALEIALAETDENGEAPDYLPVIREHLQRYRDGDTVSEDVP
jgi:TPR repeat protein